MDKIAQKMKLRHKLREKLDPVGNATEKLFNPRFQDVMINLRKADDQIRSIVAGERLGDGDLGKDPIAMKDLLRSAKTNTNRREYMKAVADMSRFHAKLREIEDVLGKLDIKVNEVHHEFLFNQLDDEHKGHLHDLENRWKEAAAELQGELVKEAGVWDMIHNISTERGRSLRGWEKRYPDKTKDLKRALVVLQDAGDKTYANLINGLKVLGSFRSARNPEKYMEAANAKNGVVGGAKEFDKLFKALYNGGAKGFPADFSIKKVIADLKKQVPAEKVPAEETKDMGAQPVAGTEKGNTEVSSIGPTPGAPGATPAAAAPGGVAPTVDMPAVPPADHKTTPDSHPPSGMEAPSGPPAAVSPPSAPPAVEPKPAPPPPPAPTPEEIEADRERLMGPHGAHTNFYASLQKMSGEDPLLLAGYISKYAKKIQASDPTTSIQLFNIVKRIKG